MRLISIPLLYIAYAVVRTVAAAIRALRARTLGASIGMILAQGVSDVSLSLGIIAFGNRNVAQRLGGVLELLVTYAIIWETYGWMTRIAEQRDAVVTTLMANLGCNAPGICADGAGAYILYGSKLSERFGGQLDDLILEGG